RLGKTMVLVTHDLGEAFRLADRVAVMRAGRVLRIGTPEELAREPGDGYVRALLEVGGWG
ncbi:MAG: glycine/betaine ABC transporter ATP-binding protein, partial [Acidobacteriota bacterium]